MPNRISSAQIAESSLLGIHTAYNRFDAAQRKINTGKQVLTVSDNPSGSAQILNLRGRVREVEQFNRIIDHSKGYLQTSDTALDSVNALVRQARTLAVQAASGNISQESRNGLANQVDNIIGQIGSIGNTTYNGRFVFSGQLTNIAPLRDNGQYYSYHGGTQAAGNADIVLDIGRNESIKVNVTGDEVFLPVIQALERLRDHMASGSTQIISYEDLPDLDKQISNILSVRADIGAKIQRLDNTKDRNELMRINFTRFISDVEDADIPKTVIEFQLAQTAYQAAIQSTARVFQTSLLDFLR
jgi:flagellar hook-associated protein 3 FlgL